MASKAGLVEQIKSIQRSDPEAKQGWWDYCDQNLGGVKDPNRHDEGVLQEFLNAYNTGSLPAAQPAPRRPATQRANPMQQSYGYPSPAGWGYAQQSWGMPAAGGWGSAGGASGGNHLSEMIKTGQRHSEAWKSAWRSYCSVQGTGKFDPTKYDEEFISGFVNYCGELACNAMGIQPGDTPEDGGCGGTKRAMPSSAMSYAPPAKRPALGGGDAEKTELVNKIKALQRSDPDAKGAWWQFCDEQMEGVKDPNRHEKETLQQFLMSYS